MQDRAIAFRELSLMLGAGIHIARALEVLATTMQDRELSAAFRFAVQAVNRGYTLSGALTQYRHVFPDLALELIRVGEFSGRLKEMLATLASYLEKSTQLRLRVRSALTYPCFLFGLCLLVILTVPALLFDGVFALLRDMHVQVPLLTSVMMSLTGCLKSPAAYILAIATLVGLSHAYRGLMRVEAYRLKRDRTLLKLWVVGPCLRFVSVSMFALSLEALYGSGVPIIQALQTAGRASGNLAVQEAACRAADAVAEGANLHTALEQTRFFPSSFVHLMAAGTESGTIGEMLNHVVKITQDEVEHRIGTAVAALEPAMLLSMGFMVGTMILATISPLLKVLESLTV